MVESRESWRLATLRLENAHNLFEETTLMKSLLVFFLLTANVSAQLIDGTFPVVSNLLHKHNFHQSWPTKGLQTKAARKWLKDMPLPVIDRLEINQLVASWELHDQHLEAQVWTSNNAGK